AIEQPDRWRDRYNAWKRKTAKGPVDEIGHGYPLVENARAPFTPARRALSMANLALIVSAGAYIDGTDPFDVSAPDGDFTFRDIPSQIDLRDLRFSARGYDAVFVHQGPNVQVAIVRLLEFAVERASGQVTYAWRVSFAG